MLSAQLSNMDQRPRHHRRQQSTPSNFEATQTPFSSIPHQHVGAHRRGLSLIQPATAFKQVLQEENMVGITNIGRSQHYLQVAQQHDQARPGQQQGGYKPLQLSEEEFRNLQHRQLDAQIDSFIRGNSIAPYDNRVCNDEEQQTSEPKMKIFPGVDIANTAQPCSIALPTAGFLAPPLEVPEPVVQDPASPHHDWSVSEAQSGLPTNWISQMQRPCTPANQGHLGYFPMTPATPPFLAAYAGAEARRQVQIGIGDDMSATATIKASVSRATPRSRPCSDVLQWQKVEELDPNATIRAGNRPVVPRTMSCSDLFHGREGQSDKRLPSPPHTAAMKCSRTFDVATMPDAATLDSMPKFPLGSLGDELSFKHLLDQAQQLVPSPGVSSMPASPEFDSGHEFPDVRYESSTDVLSPFPGSRTSMDLSNFGSPVRVPLSPADMPFNDLDLDAAIEDTGVSPEEVQSYIGEQDMTTGKWTCMYPECEKRFGRKENIRSHVQTHLGDRQYRCLHCSKRFVRQHDLKRHSKIHSGVKPYPCRCGNSFARHDALTRHRQRGICDGGFEGVVKRVVKRGRPTKERPSTDERLDKASRTRQRAAMKSYASSISDTSESSIQGSPPSKYHDSFEATSGETDVFALLDNDSLAYNPSVFSYTPPMSPKSTGDWAAHREGTSNPPSVSRRSTPPTEGNQIAPRLEEHEAMRTREQAHLDRSSSCPTSPPELSHSSPPPSSSRMDLDLASLLLESEGEGGNQESHCNTTVDFDMFTVSDASHSMLGNMLSDSSFMHFDKDSGNLHMESFMNSFDDDVLFSENCQGGDHYL